MAKKEYIQRYLMIIKKLKEKPATFDEIITSFRNQEVVSGYKYQISKRTLQRDFNEIYTIYGYEIKFNKKEGYYEIVDEDDETPFERIVDAFETLNALNLSNGVSNKIILEKKAKSGTNYFTGLLYAIENYFEVEIEHQSYWKEVSDFRKIYPIAIKENQNRWYLVCYDSVKLEIRNFGLDRILSLKISENKFKPISFDVKNYYQNAFGIETYGAAEKITLNFSELQAKYIRSMPLHSSQKEIVNENSICKFEYFMHPTNDLIMEIMKYGENVFVEKPVTLRETVKNRIKNTLALYQ